MEDKQLNFNQPLLSVRRGTLTTAVAEVDRRKPTNPPPSIYTLPYYKSELKSGPVSNPGVVPFQWERKPGKPKNDRKQNTKALDQPPPPAPKLPPGRVVNTDESEKLLKDSQGSKSQRVHDAGVSASLEDDSSHSDGESSTYLDALDTLSRSESFMNCSLSGVSGLDGPCTKSSGTFSDPQTRDFMMGRFLPAAKAVASETPHFGSRKQSATKEQPKDIRYYYTPSSLPQYHEDIKDEDVDEYEEEEGDSNDDDYAGSEIVSTKLCGLLPRFCLLNSMVGVKYQAPLPLPSVHKTQKKLSDPGIYEYNKSEKAIRDAVYEKRRLTVYQRSNTRVEAGHLKDELKKHNEQTSSLNLDDLSQIANLENNYIASFRNVTRQSLMDEEKGFLGIPEASIHSRESNLSLQKCLDDETAEDELTLASAVIEKTLYVDSMQSKAYRDSSSSSSDSKSMTESRGRKPSIDYSMQDIKDIYFADQKTLPHSANLAIGHCKLVDAEVQQHSTNPMLPPPLPKSPSESWLLRALPSMSIKHPHSKTYLGTKNPALKPLSAEPKWESVVKCSSLHNNSFGHPALTPISEN